MPDENQTQQTQPSGVALTQPAAGSVQSQTQAKVERPAEIGKQFDAYWVADKGLDYPKLTGDFDALRAVKAEQDSRLARVPDKIEDYEVALPADFKMPDGMKFEIDPKSPLLGPAREFAKAHNLSKDEFKSLVALQAKAMIAENEALQVAAKAEREKLGSKAQERLTAITQFLQAKLGNESANVLLPGIFTARQVEAYEKLMDLAKGGGPKFNGAGRESDTKPAMTHEEFSALSPTQQIEVGRKLDAAKRKAA